MDVDGQDCYTLIADCAERLSTEEGFAEALGERYAQVMRKAFTKDNLIFMSVTSEEESDAVVNRTLEAVSALPEKLGADAEYALPEAGRSLAVCIEDSMNNSYIAADCMDDPEFIGNYLPFWYALSDLYTVPTFRFKLDAYSAGSYHQWGQGCLLTYVTSDPNVRATLDALNEIPDVIGEMQLDAESLDGYILNAYGNATAPQGMLSDAMLAMQLDLYGIDAERTLAIKKQIRDAKLEDQAAAAEHIAEVLSGADYCMVGNEGLIRADADCFEEIVSWCSGSGEPQP